MTTRPTRRGFLAAAAALGGAAAVPVICSSPAHAVAGRGELPVVNRPDHPAAVYASGDRRSAHAEPLNASVDCEMHGRSTR
ncbi:twin-arginine translocation signal domain-containing protein [Streptomyces sp. DSM 42041]|uniref:Twin-arginine translocation signal domain-containing protein n=1 Tax=Streptomyces hazeniae TaxID=3075538 RepID=A0ABU2NRZ7_9ACTN|nr:twin-arginine translocation signal domain-containing protein [Streptomyces sp. DSM 42041]MDT0379371.1 twin-arginine translocation signal domain-containing protein [Streptomyces sp. DSM 42041]